ncbi:unnamed protein product, partial [marine sediment metagenome]
MLVAELPLVFLVLGAVELAVLARAPVQELGLAPELEPVALVQV